MTEETKAAHEIESDLTKEIHLARLAGTESNKLLENSIWSTNVTLFVKQKPQKYENCRWIKCSYIINTSF